MKKYLITGAMALIAGFYLTSCTHDDIEYSSLYEEKTQSYDKVFKELYGTIDPNHDWGFKSLGSAYSGTRALTRGEDINGNLWYQNWERPVNVTNQEMDPDGKVVQYFKQERGENEITITWDNYWVQQVYQSNNPYTAVDNLNHYNASEKMNHLLCYDHSAAGGYQHSYDFNAGNNTTVFTDDEDKSIKYVGTTLMKDMGSYSGTNAQFGYHNSVDSKNHFEYFIVAGETIDPNDPLLAGHYYVGFDFSCTGSNPNMQVERDHKYDDWIVRISPATRQTSTGPQGGGGETTTSKKYKADQHMLLAKGRVFVEDLFKASREDIDFNDAVFDAIIWEVTRGTVTVEDGTKTFVRDETIAAKDSVEISLLAAGGTIPLKIADGKFGEVHEAFHKSGVTMVNTRGNYSEAYGSYENGVTPVYGKFDYTEELANKNTEDITLNDIQVAAFWKSNDYTAAAILNNGESQFDEDGKIKKQTEAPHMLCAPIGTRWATERKNIMEGYPGFRAYVNSSSNSNVWGSATPESSFNLYEDNPSPLKYGSEDEGFVYYDNIEEITNYEGIVMWQGSVPLGNWHFFDLAIPQGGVTQGQKIIFTFIHTHNEWNKGYFQVASEGFKLYYLGGLETLDESVSITLTSEQAAQLSSDKKIQIQGSGMTITNILLQ